MYAHTWLLGPSSTPDAGSSCLISSVLPLARGSCADAHVTPTANARAVIYRLRGRTGQAAVCSSTIKGSSCRALRAGDMNRTRKNPVRAGEALESEKGEGERTCAGYAASKGTSREAATHTKSKSRPGMWRCVLKVPCQGAAAAGALRQALRNALMRVQQHTHARRRPGCRAAAVPASCGVRCSGHVGGLSWRGAPAAVLRGVAATRGMSRHRAANTPLEQVIDERAGSPSLRVASSRVASSALRPTEMRSPGAALARGAGARAGQSSCKAGGACICDAASSQAGRRPAATQWARRGGGGGAFPMKCY